jgi:DNA-binding Lrp family transcriptional regulator
MKTKDQQPQQQTAPLVHRGRGATAEAQRDADILRFIGRFRFVTDELIAQKFEVSRQQTNLRLRRLTQAGYLQRTDARTQPRLTMLTRKGARAVGLPVRRPPRTDAQREHELALVWLVIELERAGTVQVRTERECRTLEAAGAGEYSVPVLQPDRPQERRWPDLVLEGEGRRSAIELELSAKGATRLQAIVDAYAVSNYDEIVFLTGDRSIARVVEAAGTATNRVAAAGSAWPNLRVAPRPKLDVGRAGERTSTRGRMMSGKRACAP